MALATNTCERPMTPDWVRDVCQVANPDWDGHWSDEQAATVDLFCTVGSDAALLITSACTHAQGGQQERAWELQIALATPSGMALSTPSSVDNPSTSSVSKDQLDHIHQKGDNDATSDEEKRVETLGGSTPDKAHRDQPDHTHRGCHNNATCFPRGKNENLGGSATAEGHNARQKLTVVLLKQGGGSWVDSMFVVHGNIANSICKMVQETHQPWFLHRNCNDYSTGLLAHQLQQSQKLVSHLRSQEEQHYIVDMPVALVHSDAIGLDFFENLLLDWAERSNTALRKPISRTGDAPACASTLQEWLSARQARKDAIIGTLQMMGSPAVREVLDQVGQESMTHLLELQTVVSTLQNAAIVEKKSCRLLRLLETPASILASASPSDITGALPMSVMQTICFIHERLPEDRAIGAELKAAVVSSVMGVLINGLQKVDPFSDSGICIVTACRSAAQEWHAAHDLMTAVVCGIAGEGSFARLRFFVQRCCDVAGVAAARRDFDLSSIFNDQEAINSDIGNSSFDGQLRNIEARFNQGLHDLMQAVRTDVWHVATASWLSMLRSFQHQVARLEGVVAVVLTLTLEATLESNASIETLVARLEAAVKVARRPLVNKEVKRQQLRLLVQLRDELEDLRREYTRVTRRQTLDMITSPPRAGAACRLVGLKQTSKRKVDLAMLCAEIGKNTAYHVIDKRALKVVQQCRAVLGTMDTDEHVTAIHKLWASEVVAMPISVFLEAPLLVATRAAIGTRKMLQLRINLDPQVVMQAEEVRLWSQQGYTVPPAAEDIRERSREVRVIRLLVGQLVHAYGRVRKALRQDKHRLLFSDLVRRVDARLEPAVTGDLCWRSRRVEVDRYVKGCLAIFDEACSIVARFMQTEERIEAICCEIAEIRPFNLMDHRVYTLPNFIMQATAEVEKARKCVADLHGELVARVDGAMGALDSPNPDVRRQRARFRRRVDQRVAAALSRMATSGLFALHYLLHGKKIDDSAAFATFKVQCVLMNGGSLQDPSTNIEIPGKEEIHDLGDKWHADTVPSLDDWATGFKTLAQAVVHILRLRRVAGGADDKPSSNKGVPRDAARGDDTDFFVDFIMQSNESLVTATCGLQSLIVVSPACNDSLREWNDCARRISDLTEPILTPLGDGTTPRQLMLRQATESLVKELNVHCVNDHCVQPIFEQISVADKAAVCDSKLTQCAASVENVVYALSQVHSHARGIPNQFVSSPFLVCASSAACSLREATLSRQSKIITELRWAQKYLSTSIIAAIRDAGDRACSGVVASDTYRLVGQIRVWGGVQLQLPILMAAVKDEQALVGTLARLTKSSTTPLADSSESGQHDVNVLLQHLIEQLEKRRELLAAATAAQFKIVLRVQAEARRQGHRLQSLVALTPLGWGDGSTMEAAKSVAVLLADVEAAANAVDLARQHTDVLRLVVGDEWMHNLDAENKKDKNNPHQLTKSSDEREWWKRLIGLVSGMVRLLQAADEWYTACKRLLAMSVATADRAKIFGVVHQCSSILRQLADGSPTLADTRVWKVLSTQVDDMMRALKVVRLLQQPGARNMTQGWEACWPSMMRPNHLLIPGNRTGAVAGPGSGVVEAVTTLGDVIVTGLYRDEGGMHEAGTMLSQVMDSRVDEESIVGRWRKVTFKQFSKSKVHPVEFQDQGWSGVKNVVNTLKYLSSIATEDLQKLGQAGTVDDRKSWIMGREELTTRLCRFVQFVLMATQVDASLSAKGLSAVRRLDQESFTRLKAASVDIVDATKDYERLMKTVSTSQDLVGNAGRDGPGNWCERLQRVIDSINRVEREISDVVKHARTQCGRLHLLGWQTIVELLAQGVTTDVLGGHVATLFPGTAGIQFGRTVKGVPTINCILGLDSGLLPLNRPILVPTATSVLDVVPAMEEEIQQSLTRAIVLCATRKVTSKLVGEHTGQVLQAAVLLSWTRSCEAALSRPDNTSVEMALRASLATLSAARRHTCEMARRAVGTSLVHISKLRVLLCAQLYARNTIEQLLRGDNTAAGRKGIWHRSLRFYLRGNGPSATCIVCQGDVVLSYGGDMLDDGLDGAAFLSLPVDQQVKMMAVANSHVGVLYGSEMVPILSSLGTLIGRRLILVAPSTAAALEMYDNGRPSLWACVGASAWAAHRDRHCDWHSPAGGVVVNNSALGELLPSTVMTAEVRFLLAGVAGPGARRLACDLHHGLVACLKLAPSVTEFLVDHKLVAYSLDPFPSSGDSPPGWQAVIDALKSSAGPRLPAGVYDKVFETLTSYTQTDVLRVPETETSVDAVVDAVNINSTSKELRAAIREEQEMSGLVDEDGSASCAVEALQRATTRSQFVFVAGPEQSGKLTLINLLASAHRRLGLTTHVVAAPVLSLLTAAQLVQVTEAELNQKKQDLTEGVGWMKLAESRRQRILAGDENLWVVADVRGQAGLDINAWLHTQPTGHRRLLLESVRFILIVRECAVPKWVPANVPGVLLQNPVPWQHVVSRATGGDSGILSSEEGEAMAELMDRLKLGGVVSGARQDSGAELFERPIGRALLAERWCIMLRALARGCAAKRLADLRRVRLLGAVWACANCCLTSEGVTVVDNWVRDHDQHVPIEGTVFDYGLATSGRWEPWTQLFSKERYRNSGTTPAWGSAPLLSWNAAAGWRVVSSWLAQVAQ